MDNIRSVVAGADLSAKQYLCVYLDSSDAYEAKVYTTTEGEGVNNIGILQNAPADGKEAFVAFEGCCKAQFGGNVAPGDLLTRNADGKLVAASKGQRIVARALPVRRGSAQRSYVSGDVGEVEVLAGDQISKGARLRGTKVHNFTSINDGAEASTTLTVTGAATTDGVLVTAPSLEAGLHVRGYVSAANTVTIKVLNASGGAIDPASQDFLVDVF